MWNKYLHIHIYIYIYIWIELNILFYIDNKLNRIISKIYIVQTKHPTTMKIYIILYVIMHSISFKTCEWMFSGLAENSSCWYLEVVGLNPATVDFCRALALRVYSAHSVKWVPTCWLVVDSDCTCARVEADIRRARHKQYTHAHTCIAYGYK